MDREIKYLLQFCSEKGRKLIRLLDSLHRGSIQISLTISLRIYFQS